MFTLDPVREDILSSMQNALPGYGVARLEMPPQLILRSAMFCVVINAPEGDSLNVFKREQKLSRGYIAALGPTGSCFMKTHIVSEKESESSVCVEVRVDIWEVSREEILKQLAARIESMAISATTVVKDCTTEQDEAFEKLNWEIMAEMNRQSMAEFQKSKRANSRIGGCDVDLKDAEVYVMVSNFTAYGHQDFQVDRDAVQRHLDSLPKGYVVRNSKYDLEYYVYMHFIGMTREFLTSGSVHEVAKRIDGDTNKLHLAIDLEYYHALHRHLAQLQGVQIANFSDDLGRELVGGSEFRVIRTSAEDIFKSRANSGFNPLSSFAMWVRYKPGYQMFGVEMGGFSSAFAESVIEEKENDFIDSIKKKAADLGFLIYLAGCGCTHQEYFILKPIGGNFDYHKTLPELCELMIEGLSKCVDIQKYQEEVVRWAEFQSKIGRG